LNSLLSEALARLRASQLQAASCKLQAASCKLQAASCKLQAASCKLQAASCKRNQDALPYRAIKSFL
jgi:division protein CdvB (Snf7/Vps24/ESCRT-III family)